MVENNISKELQDCSDQLFTKLRDQLEKDFGHVYKDVAFINFFENTVRTLVSETMNYLFGDSSGQSEIQERTMKMFDGIVEKEILPLFTSIKLYGQRQDVDQEMLPDYTYNYCIRSLSNILPEDVANQLQDKLEQTTKNLAPVTAEKKKLNKEHIVNLINLAKADGNFDSSEKQFLKRKAEKLHVNVKEIENVFEKETTDEILVPTDLFRRIEYFVDLVLMMSADDEIHEDENKFCMRMGKAYKFPEDKVQECLDIFSNTVKQGRPAITAVPAVIRTLKDLDLF